mmetsp:Transcript_27853/g.24488  ORF Transcript_27853/g.24488 Transcript_27853/m.24488 type:complete len:98 (-) Transcript_27853:339-632(-)
MIGEEEEEEEEGGEGGEEEADEGEEGGEQSPTLEANASHADEEEDEEEPFDEDHLTPANESPVQPPVEENEEQGETFIQENGEDESGEVEPPTQESE